MIEQSIFAFEQILQNTFFVQKHCFSSVLILVFQSLQKRSTKNVGLLEKNNLTLLLSEYLQNTFFMQIRLLFTFSDTCFSKSTNKQYKNVRLLDFEKKG